MTEPLTNFKDMLKEFIKGTNQSTQFVNLIESTFIEIFPDEEDFPDKEVYIDIEVALASYEPGGGDYLYNEQDMVRLFREVLTVID